MTRAGESTGREGVVRGDRTGREQGVLKPEEPGPSSSFISCMCNGMVYRENDRKRF